MRTIRKTPAVSRARAIEIAMNHNCVTREVAESYTDSELKEVLQIIFGSKIKFISEQG